MLQRLIPARIQSGNPRIPRMDTSSSMSGQWIPQPRPISLQFFRCSGDASRRRGNHSSGAEMERPSARAKVTEWALKLTSSATGSRVMLKVLIPSLHKDLLVRSDQGHKFRKLVRTETIGRSEIQAGQPYLGFLARRFYVDMGGFVIFPAEKEKTVGADTQDCGHAAFLGVPVRLSECPTFACSRQTKIGCAAAVFSDGKGVTPAPSWLFAGHDQALPPQACAHRRESNHLNLWLFEISGKGGTKEGATGEQRSFWSACFFA